ncbi:hypothetical protein BGZ91_011623 [Linnemannia elongata]|nr:hypothetical protein BGZ91_011623 [Linnemannia elongata]
MRLRQPELVVSRLTGATRLCCYHTVDEVSRDVKNPFKSNIRDVIVDSQVEYRKQLETRNQTATHKHKPAIHSFSPLREMDIEIVQYISGSFDTFPFPETLANVTLYIHSSRNASFNLTGSCVGAPCWGCFRSRPSGVLKLIGMISSGIDLTLLCGYIKTLSLDLEMHPTVILAAERTGSPHALFDNTPTSLAAEGPFAAYEGCRNDIVTASRLLFEYLCNSPSAANLKSLKTGVLFQNMDVFGRGQPFDTSFSPSRRLHHGRVYDL